MTNTNKTIMSDKTKTYTPTADIAKTHNRKLQGCVGILNGEYVADITFDKGVISATDPCYNGDVWCRKDNIKIVPGDYQVNTYTDDNGRVTILQIILKDQSVIDRFNSKSENIDKSWRTIAENIGVDAGLCGFFQDKPDFTDKEWEDFCQNISYDGDGNLWEGKRPNEKGFFTESGYGDGIYSCHAIRMAVGNRKTPRIVALELRF